MRGLVTYFIKYPIAANILMFALIIMGVLAATQLKFTFFPEIEERVVQVQVVYPGASPSEIEDGIIAKIEEEVKGITGIKKIQSTSTENSGAVTVLLYVGENVDQRVQDIKSAVDRVTSFPSGMEPPIIQKLEFLGAGIFLSLTGSNSLLDLKKYARNIETELKEFDGLSKVTINGYPEEEIEIAFREDDLRAYQITFQEAASAVRSSNIELTGGRLKSQDEEFIIRSRNKKYSGDGLKDIVIKTYANGQIVRLSDVANINDQWEDAPDRIYIDGVPAVQIYVQNTASEDIIEISEIVKEYVADFNKRNEEVQLTILEDESVIIKARTALLTKNGVVGFLIVLVLLAIFLHWRVAFWVAIAIPISFCGMFIMAVIYGVTLNVITLFGMILVIGILVDDGIVIGENIYQLYEQGYNRTEAAIKGTLEVLPAVFSAILTTVIAFATFFYIEGTLGDFFYEMAVVVIFALVFSLVEGAFILPAHLAHSKALSADSKSNKLQDAFDRVMYWMREKLYAPILRFSINNKIIVLAVSTSTLLLSIGALAGGIVKTTFFPVIPGETVVADLKMPSGTRESVVLEQLNRIEAAGKEINKELSEKYLGGELMPIEAIQKSLGPSINEGSIKFILIDSEKSGEMTDLIFQNALREKVGPVYGAEVLTYNVGAPFGAPFNLSFLGDDYDQLVGAVAAAQAKMKLIPDIKDVVNNNQEGVREINLKLNKKGEYLGFNLQQVIGQVRSGFFGEQVQSLQRGRDEVKVWVRYGSDDRNAISKLMDMRIRSSTGTSVPLREIAELEIERGVIAIRRLDGKQEIRIEADVAHKNVSVSEITALLSEELVPEVLKDYPGVEVDLGGQNEDQQDTAESSQRILPFIMLLMFIVIAMTFRSVGQTIAVFALIPFGFIGVVIGHYILDITISLFSYLGMVALLGIIVNDALVMVSKYNGLIAAGLPVEKAIYEAGISRFRPITLTSVTTFAGLAPLLFEKSLQAQFLIPMALSIAFGLLVVTFIILVLLPVLLILLNQVKTYSIWAWEGTRIKREIVEPSYTGISRLSQSEYTAFTKFRLGDSDGLDMDQEESIKEHYEVIPQDDGSLVLKEKDFQGRISHFFLWLIGGVLSLGVIGGIIYLFIMVTGQIIG